MEYVALGVLALLVATILGDCAMALRGRDDGWPDVLVGICGVTVVSLAWVMLAYSCVTTAP